MANLKEINTKTRKACKNNINKIHVYQWVMVAMLVLRCFGNASAEWEMVNSAHSSTKR